MKNPQPQNSSGVNVSQNYIQELIEDLTREGVQFIIAGGVAVVLHGVSRATMDIDASISLKSENIQKLLRVMERNCMTPRAPISPKVLLDPAERDRMIKDKGAIVFTFVDHERPYKQLDVFLTEDLSYEALCNDVDLFQIGKVQVRVLSKKKLIELKKAITPARSKDLLDIEELSKLED